MSNAAHLTRVLKSHLQKQAASRLNRILAAKFEKAAIGPAGQLATPASTAKPAAPPSQPTPAAPPKPQFGTFDGEGKAVHGPAAAKPTTAAPAADVSPHSLLGRASEFRLNINPGGWAGQQPVPRQPVVANPDAPGMRDPAVPVAQRSIIPEPTPYPAEWAERRSRAHMDVAKGNFAPLTPENRELTTAYVEGRLPGQLYAAAMQQPRGFWDTTVRGFNEASKATSALGGYVTRSLLPGDTANQMWNASKLHAQSLGNMQDSAAVAAARAYLAPTVPYAQRQAHLDNANTYNDVINAEQAQWGGSILPFNLDANIVQMGDSGVLTLPLTPLSTARTISNTARGVGAGATAAGRFLTGAKAITPAAAPAAAAASTANAASPIMRALSRSEPWTDLLSVTDDVAQNFRDIYKNPNLPQSESVEKSRDGYLALYQALEDARAGNVPLTDSADIAADGMPQPAAGTAVQTPAQVDVPEQPGTAIERGTPTPADHPVVKAFTAELSPQTPEQVTEAKHIMDVAAKRVASNQMAPLIADQLKTTGQVVVDQPAVLQKTQQELGVDEDAAAAITSWWGQPGNIAMTLGLGAGAVALLAATLGGESGLMTWLLAALGIGVGALGAGYQGYLGEGAQKSIQGGMESLMPYLGRMGNELGIISDDAYAEEAVKRITPEQRAALEQARSTVGQVDGAARRLGSGLRWIGVPDDWAQSTENAVSSAKGNIAQRLESEIGTENWVKLPESFKQLLQQHVEGKTTKLQQLFNRVHKQ